MILLGKRRGCVITVRPLLDELVQQGFWISSTFYQDALREAGE